MVKRIILISKIHLIKKADGERVVGDTMAGLDTTIHVASTVIQVFSYIST